MRCYSVACCFPDNCSPIKNRTVGNRTIVRLSLCPLLNPVESEAAQATSAFADLIAALSGVKRREGVFNRQPIE